MKLLWAMIRYEALLQLRSTRFRIAAVGYVALCALPPCLVVLGGHHQTAETLGAAAYLAQLLQVQPYFTMLMVVLIAGGGSGADALKQRWAVLAASPVSNAGYVVRRWLALLALILPLAFMPQVVALVTAMASGNRQFDAATWFGAWALWILPMAVALTAYWLAWVMITGGELAALIVTLVVLPLVISTTNQVLLRFHLTLSEYLQWFNYRGLFFWTMFTAQDWGLSRSKHHPGYLATEAPFDPAAAVGWLLPMGAVIAGVAALGLGLACAFVRRTRRDLPPRPVPPEHQLRTFLEKLNRWRQRYAPDGALGPRERLAMAAGVVALGLALAGVLGRQAFFQNLAAERYRAETKHDYEPLPATVELTTWRAEGRVEDRGAVAIEAGSRFQNQGAAPVAALAFSLNPELQIERLDVPSRRVEVTRAWDRLLLRLDPALAPGESADLELRLSGVPVATEFDFKRNHPPFAVRYDRLINARFPRQVSNLSSSWRRRAASPRRVQLAASDLAPVPRYTRWTLTRPDESRGDGAEASEYGREVPLESARIVTDVELDLEVPAGWLLADTCGNVSRSDASRARFSSACRTSLAELTIAGGRLMRVTAAEAVAGQAADVNVVVAALPRHLELAEHKLGSLARVASLSDRAWPGMPGLDGLAALEWPPEFHLDLRSEMSDWGWPPHPRLLGRMLLIPERTLVDDEPFEVEDLVAQLLSRDLLERRRLAEDQEPLFRHLFRVLMIRRMGLDGDRGATVSGKPWTRQALRTPILSARSGFGIVWRLRLPAVLVDIEGRIGGEHLYAGIEKFLAADDDAPGTIEDLLAALEAESGVSLERTYQDHFVGDALPLLQLEEVRSRRLENGWDVEGKVRNTGTGQAICPVIVKTEVGERTLTVTVDSESATAFATRVETRPHTVLLDPERTCYRFLLKTSPALERANLLGAASS